MVQYFCATDKEAARYSRDGIDHRLYLLYQQEFMPIQLWKRCYAVTKLWAFSVDETMNHIGIHMLNGLSTGTLVEMDLY